MTQDEIIAMAKEAGFRIGQMDTMHDSRTLVKPAGFDCLAELVRFAELAATKEREACAQVCDKALESIWEYHSEEVKTTAKNVCVNLAGGIRTRSAQ